jgi:hypothetical protein
MSWQTFHWDQLRLLVREAVMQFPGGQGARFLLVQWILVRLWLVGLRHRQPWAMVAQRH